MPYVSLDRGFIQTKRDNFDREAQNCERVRLPRVDMRVLGYTKGRKVRFIWDHAKKIEFHQQSKGRKRERATFQKISNKSSGVMAFSCKLAFLEGWSFQVVNERAKRAKRKLATAGILMIVERWHGISKYIFVLSSFGWFGYFWWFGWSHGKPI